MSYISILFIAWSCCEIGALSAFRQVEMTDLFPCSIWASTHTDWLMFWILSVRCSGQWFRNKQYNMIASDVKPGRHNDKSLSTGSIRDMFVLFGNKYGSLYILTIHSAFRLIIKNFEWMPVPPFYSMLRSVPYVMKQAVETGFTVACNSYLQANWYAGWRSTYSMSYWAADSNEFTGRSRFLLGLLLLYMISEPWFMGPI